MTELDLTEGASVQAWLAAVRRNGIDLGHPLPAHPGGRPRFSTGNSRLRQDCSWRRPAHPTRRPPRALPPLLSRWRIVLGYTAVEIAIPWLLLSEAEVRLSSSLAGLLIASVPLIGAIILAFLPHDRHDERLTTTRIIGLAIASAALVSSWGSIFLPVTSGLLWKCA